MMENDKDKRLTAADLGEITLASLEADPRNGRPGALLNAVRKDGALYPIAGVYLTDTETSNAFAAEIARRFNLCRDGEGKGAGDEG